MATLLERAIARIDEIAPRIEWLPLALARWTLGWVFLQSGWGKLHNLEGSRISSSPSASRLRISRHRSSPASSSAEDSCS